jgi:hypothetical protein
MTVIGFIGLWAGLAALTLLAVMLPTWRPPKWLCDTTGLPIFPKDSWQTPAIQRQRSVLGDSGSDGHQGSHHQV